VPSTGRRAVITLLLFVALYAFFAVTFDFRNLTDTNLHSRQTETLVLHGTVDLSGQKLLPAEFAFPHDGKIYSEFGVGISVVSAPVYAVLTRLDASRKFMAGATAIAFVTGATLVLHRVLLKLVQPLIAGAASAVFALATPMWPIATTALHEHSAVALFQSVGLFGLFSRARWAPLVSGLGFGFATFVRPTETIVAGLVGLFYLLRERRHRAVAYAAGAMVGIVGLVIQNRWLWGNWLQGGYVNNPEGFHGDPASGLFGLLLGWWRGMLVYTPVLVLGFVGLYLVLRKPRGFVEERMVVLGVASVAMIGLYSFWTEWWGGTSQYGYRFLLEIVPFLVVLGAFAVERIPRLRRAAVVLATVSVANMAFGMAPNRFAWDGVEFPSRFSDSPIGQAWIVFAHRPGGSLLRIAGVAALAVLFVVTGRRLAETAAAPLDPAIP
jgi:hypothetical protein